MLLNFWGLSLPSVKRVVKRVKIIYNVFELVAKKS